MTEQEAISVLKMIETHGSLPTNAKDEAIKALEEIKLYHESKLSLVPSNIFEEICKENDEYKAIGTPEECRAAVEVKKEITEIVNRQLIAGNYKETYNCFYEIVKIIQDNY